MQVLLIYYQPFPKKFDFRWQKLGFSLFWVSEFCPKLGDWVSEVRQIRPYVRTHVLFCKLQAKYKELKKSLLEYGYLIFFEKYL